LTRNFSCDNLILDIRISRKLPAGQHSYAKKNIRLWLSGYPSSRGEGINGIIGTRIAEKQASIAKITRPGAAGIFPRKRLFALLDAGKDSSVISIVSPPGSGKTSLITSYLGERKIPCLWYSLDEGDADIGTFFYYTGLAARKAAPGKRKPLPLFTPEYAQGIRVFSKRYFENLFSKVPTPFVFVFDNYQEVPLNSRFHEIMSNGLSDIPSGISVVISSRKELPLSFSRMRANGRVYSIGRDEMRFTIDELAELVQLKMPERLKDRLLHYLHDKADGWAAGLVLMLESLKRGKIEYQSLEQISSEKIFDYFAYEVFRNIDEETQKFLLVTAFLPAMTKRMAEQLTHINSSERILENLSNENYFTETFFEDKPVYHYHPLFREFLLSRAKASLDVEDLSVIRKRAASLLEEAGRADDAVQLLHESGDVKNIARIIRSRAESLVGQGRYQTLLKWLNFLPEKALSNDPWLLYWKGICRLPFNPMESRVCFEEAFIQFKLQKSAGTFLAWAGIVESIMYGNEGLMQLDSWFPVIDELLKQFKGFPSEYVETNVTCTMIRALALRRPAGFNMKKWLDRSHEIAEMTTDTTAKIRCLTNLACYLYSEGNFKLLEVALNSLGVMMSRADVPPLARLTADWIKAAYFNAMSLYDRCEKAVSGGLELAHTLKINLMEYMLLGHGALCSLKKRDLITARQFIQRMITSLNVVKPWEASFYHYCSAWEAMYRDDISNARVHTEHCMKLCEESGNPWTFSMAHILSAYVLSASGEHKKVIEKIRKALSIGIHSRNEFTPFICLLTEAYFYLRQGKEAAALESIRNGMRIGREKGFVNLFMWLPGVMESVAAKAIEKGIEVAYVKNLIRRNALLPDASHTEIEEWPWPLKIFTLGRFSIMKDESPLQFSRKVQQKPLALLKALIASGGREVSEERLADILWPEAEGDTAHSAFTTTLFRLRQLLGMENALRFHQGKAYLDPRCCCVDVWIFERILGQVDAAWDERTSGKDGGKPVELAEKAMRLYTGPFLAGDNEPWMISTRERLRNKFLRNVMRLARHWEVTGDVAKAIECCQRGLEVDDLAEEFYLQMMKCYRSMGKHAEALAVYKRCHQILSSVLGIEPSRDMESLKFEILRR
jgi:LuxR family maltose regulon positive regulatory protein